MARKKKKESEGAGAGGFLTPEQQQDILGVGLVALALLVLLSLVPLSLFGALLGEGSAQSFPSGNAVGVVGGAVRGVLTAFLGAGAWLVPPLLLLLGLRSGSWGPAGLLSRLALFTAGLTVLTPLGLYVLAPDPASGGWSGGWWGEVGGGAMVGLIGWIGGIVVLGVLAVILPVLTLRWNPIRAVGRGVAEGGEMVGRGLRTVGERIRASRAEKGAAGPATAPIDDPDGVFAPEGREDEEGTGDARSGEGGAGAGDGAAADAGDARSADAGSADRLPDPTHPSRLVEGEVPPADLLELHETPGRRGMERQLDELGEVLVAKLETFNVKSELAGRTTGPVVTQFEIVPAPGVKVNRIANLDADLALAMKAPSIRIVAPIPGKGAVGVEIPNPEPEIVQLREILDAPEFRRAKGSMPLALGKDLTGRSYVADLAKMPHLLIAGATGSGKSVCINTIITSLIYKHTPETLRLLMIDPKMVELSAYADLPHLRHDVVTDPQEAAGVLKWAVLEMERRYQLLSANGVRSIAEFNKRVKDDVPLRRVVPRGGEASEGDPDRWIYDEGVLPYVVVVVDELADLMMQVQSEVEKPLAQLAQKARAIGIHLIVATQRPSVNVITGLIKANFPTRIAFRVASKTDSRTILDQNGAEALLGNGDMLFLPPGSSEPVRIQGAYLATEDTDRLIGWFREQEERRLEAEGESAAARGEPDILDEVRASEQVDASDIVEEIMGDWDELFRAAAEVCLSQQQGSTSLLQRKLRIGYGRAARIMDQLEDAGVLGPQDGTKPRDVLVTMGELDEICPAE